MSNLKTKSNTLRSTKVKSKKLTLSPSSAYEKDFYLWLRKQASALKKKDFKHLDIDNLVEEIESLGRSEKRSLISFLTVLLIHLLKIKYQPSKHSKSWDQSVRNSKLEIELILEDNPSFKRSMASSISKAYAHARKEAASETGLKIEKFPEECEWSKEELLK